MYQKVILAYRPCLWFLSICERTLTGRQKPTLILLFIADVMDMAGVLSEMIRSYHEQH